MTINYRNYRNPNDPLLKEGLQPTDAQRLFRLFDDAADGYSGDAALQAALNVVMKVLRETNDTRMFAERRWDELMGRAKHFFLERHYHNDGKRKNDFPFTQKIEVPHVSFKKQN